MKQTILIFLIATSTLVSCKKSDSGKEPEVPAEENKVASIIFKFDKTIGTSDTTIIKAYNLEQAIILAVPYDKYGNDVSSGLYIKLNGKDYTGGPFKAESPGEYKFQASWGNVFSKVHTVIARDIAEKYIDIVPERTIRTTITEGLVTTFIEFKNISTKRLKNVSFKVYCVNASGSDIKEQFTGKSGAVCQSNGLFDPNSSSYTSKFDVGYFPGMRTLTIFLNSVTLEDGTVIYSSYYPFL